MKKNRLFRLFSTFNEQDWKAYNTFAKSKYSDESLYKKIHDTIRRNKHKTISAEWLKTKINPEATDKTFRNTLSRLYPHVEEFVILQDLKNDPNSYFQAKMQSFNKRCLYEDYSHDLNDFTRKSTQNLINYWSQLDNFIIFHNQYFSEDSSKYDKQYDVLEKSYLALDNFYSEMKAFYALEFENRKKHYGVNYLENFERTKTKTIEILEDLALLQTGESAAYPRILSFLYNTNSKKISREIQITIITHLTKYLWDSIHRGEDSGELLLDIYKYSLENNLYSIQETLSPIRFDNMINVSTGFEKWEWARNLINNHSHKIDSKYRDDCLLIAEGQIHFTKDNYEEVVKLFRDRTFDLDSHKLRAKWLLLGSHFCLDRQTMHYIDNEIRSYLRFIKTNKQNFGSLTYQGSIALAQYLKKMVRQEPTKDILNELNQEKSIVLKKWLTKQLNSSAI